MWKFETYIIIYRKDTYSQFYMRLQSKRAQSISNYDFETDFNPFRVSVSNTPHRGFNFERIKSTELEYQSVKSLLQHFTSQATDERKLKLKTNNYLTFGAENSPCHQTLRSTEPQTCESKKVFFSASKPVKLDHQISEATVEQNRETTWENPKRRNTT